MTIYVVMLNGVPVQAFRREHEAEHYVDHHRHPHRCAIVEVPLKD